MTRTLTGLALVAFLSGTDLHAAQAAPGSSAGATPTIAVEEGVAAPDPRHAARRLALERTTLSEKEKLLIKRPDRERPEHPLSVPLFGRPLTIGGRYTLLTRYDNNKLLDFNFSDPAAEAAQGRVPTDDQLRLNQGLQLNLFYPFSEHIAVYLAGKLAWRNLWAEADQTREGDDFRVERGEMWLYLGNLFGSPFGLQAGRQRIFEDREWWWDQDLDAVRLRFDREKFHAELAVAQELGPVGLDDEGFTDPEDDDVLRILGAANWAWAERHQVGFYALHQSDHSNQQGLTSDLCVAEDDIPAAIPPDGREFFRTGCVGVEDESDANLTWFGISAKGRKTLGRTGKAYYWLDLAAVVGEETFTDYDGPRGSRRVGSVNQHDVSGAGIDLGSTWEIPLPFRPSLTLGYAFGSGKSGMEQETDRGFRQTGIQDNSDKFGGVASFRYYGELFDPELSNLHIVTMGLGIRFLRKSSLDFVYHLYRQAHAAPFLRDVGFKRDPDGVHRSIGQEWDLILGIEEFKMFEIKLVGAIFRPGNAFAPQAGKLSYLASLRLRLNF